LCEQICCRRLVRVAVVQVDWTMHSLYIAGCCAHAWCLDGVVCFISCCT
jgi:hypothetical protein